MAFLDIFVGAPQSKYTATAIIAAILVVSIAILFGKEDIPMGQKFSFILVVFLVSLPSIVLTLFQMTCLVTGSSKHPWCGWYAWLISAMLIVYCVLIIAIAVISFASGTDVRKELQLSQENFENSKKIADAIATQHFQSGGDMKPPTTPQTPPVATEYFADEEEFEGAEKTDEKKPEHFAEEEMTEKTEHFSSPVLGGMSIPGPVEAFQAGGEEFASVEAFNNEEFRMRR